MTLSIGTSAPTQDREAVHFPASFAQQSLWLLDQLNPGRATYNVPGGLRILGVVDVRVLERTIVEIVRRHESLRTCFAAVHGRPRQVIEDQVDIPLRLMDLRSVAGEEDREAEADRLAREIARQPFNLGKAPLLRTTLLRLGEQHHVLLFTMHHIISDAWSVAVLAQEVSALYGAFAADRPSPLLELPIQYADYSEWQRERFEAGVFDQQLAYWKQQLEGSGILELPTDHPRPALRRQNGAVIAFVIDAELTAELNKLGEKQSATLFMVLLAGFQVLLYRYSGQQDIAVGSPIAGRKRTETSGLIGFFVNTLVLRADLSGGPSFKELLRRVQKATLEAYDHQDVPFTKLVEALVPERDLSYTPLFQVMMVLQNVRRSEMRLGSAKLQPFDFSTGTAKFDLLLQLEEAGSGTLQASLEYDTDLFEAGSVNRMIAHYEMLLKGAAAMPEESIDRISLLTGEERQQIVVEWNQTEVEYPTMTLPRLLEQQAYRTPQASAVFYEGQQLTYSELHQRANRLGNHLQGLGVGPETRVGICAERSLELVIGLLAILKAGGAYVPLDPGYPEERLAYMLEDADLSVLLAQKKFQMRHDARIRRVELDGEEIAWAGASPAPVENRSWPDHAAYVIYTSGSTGRPKGAINTQAGICNRLLWMQEAYGLGAGDRVLQKTPFGFDVSVWEFFWPLATGAALALAKPEGHRDSRYLADLIERAAITTLHFVPSMLGLFLEEPGLDRCRSLRRVMSSGEALPKSTVERFFTRLPEVELHNLYGPTEAAVDVTFWSCKPHDPSPTVPIGKAIANTQLYVLDATQEPVPLGVAGELYLGGAGLGRGYLHRPEMTAERFVPHPFSAKAGARLYRTGDRVRWRSDGNLEFLGRWDEQIKLRGYRIELGEIEAALREQAEVEQAAVVVREDVPGNKQLVGYIAGESTPESAGPKATPDLDQIRNALKRRLPEYMVPARLVSLPALPLSPNGKLDRKRLPPPEDGMEMREATYIAPKTPVEEILCGIWAEVLGVQQVGIQDNFFELGGHSLLGTQVIAHIRKAFQMDVPLLRLFEAPTVAEIAKIIEDPRSIAAKQGLSPILPTPRDGHALSSYGQERLWFIHQTAPDNPSYNVPFAARIQGTIEVEVLRRSLQAVGRRHESLRTRFVVEQGALRQIVDENIHVELPLVDLTSTPEGQREGEAKRLAAVEARKPFDMAHGPLLRMKLLRLGEHDHVWVVAMHHIITDAWSVAIFTREVLALYKAFNAGRPSPLPELPIQYIDFSAWQRNWLEGAAMKEQLDYWRRRLAGMTKLQLPFDRPHPAVPSYRGERLPISWPADLSEGLFRLGRERGATLYMTVLAAFQLLLYRYTSQKDIPVGSVSAGRTHAETEAIIGFFVHTLVMRTQISEDWSFSELLRDVRKTTLDAYAHQDVPFQILVQDLVGQRDMSQSQLFQVTFNLQNVPQPVLQEGATQIRQLDFDAGTIRFDLSLNMRKSNDGVVATLNYNTDLFDAATIRGMLRRFEILIRGIVRDPEQRLSAFSMVDDAEHPVLASGMAAARNTRTGRFSMDPFSGDAQLFLLDSEFAPVPDDVVGEIFITEETFLASDDGQPAQPAASFMPNPFSEIPGARMYRTGNLARRRASGLLEYCGGRNGQASELEADGKAPAMVPDRLEAETSSHAVPRNPVEERLARIWEQSLDIEKVGIHDNFFNLGGHSMLATLVVAQISDEFHLDIPVRQFFEAPTIAQFAKVIAQEPPVGAAAETPSQILVAIQPLGPNPPFFCVHPVAGDVLCYVDLAHEVGLDQPFYGLQSPAMDSTTEPFASIEQMAALYIREIRRVQSHGPYFIGGWSMGGIVAFEMARQLNEADEKVALLALMDTSLPSPNRGAADDDGSPSMFVQFAQNMSYAIGKDPRSMSKQFLNLGEEQQRKMVLEVLQQEGALPQDTSLAEKKLQKQLDVYTRNRSAYAEYSPKRTEQKIVLLKASEPTLGDLDQKWRAWTGGVEFYAIPGSHFSMFKRPHVSVLGKSLRERINAARSVGVDA